MPKWAICPAELTEASLVIWTVLFGIRLSLHRMSKDTSVLLVALAKFDEKGADGHFFRVVTMQIPALIAFLAGASIPMNADLGFEFGLIPSFQKGRSQLLNLIDSDHGLALLVMVVTMQDSCRRLPHIIGHILLLLL